MILWLKKKPIEPEERSQEALARICEEYGFRDETDLEQFARLFHARLFLKKAEFLSRMMPLRVQGPYAVKVLSEPPQSSAVTPKPAS